VVRLCLAAHHGRDIKGAGRRAHGRLRLGQYRAAAPPTGVVSERADGGIDRPWCSARNRPIRCAAPRPWDGPPGSADVLRIRRTLLRWVVAVVAVPVAAEVADRVGRRLEATRGPSPASRGLRAGATRLRRFERRRRRA
jgi:hypothetical protein